MVEKLSNQGRIALQKVTFICAKAEKSSGEILKKLKEYGIADTEVKTIITYLLENNYIDDTRYSTAFAKEKFKFNKWGKIKIAHELRQKQISQPVIQTALDEIDFDDYIEVLKSVLTSKKSTLKTLDSFALKSKLTNYALSKGFEYEYIKDLLNNGL